MRIHFLGTGAGNFRGSRRQPCSALLDGLLLDCGAGATGRLHDIGQFASVDAVLISHLHSDHVAGLFDFLLHTLITARKRPLVVVSPPGLRGLLDAAVRVGETVADPAGLYDLRLIEGDHVETTVGRWTIRSVALDHTILNLGYLLTSDETTVFYSGDTREPSAARELRADVLVHEATYADRFASFARAYGHSTASQAAETALAMHARHLLLNHIGDQPDSEVEIPREAKAAFPGSVVTEDRSTFDF
jgi:ribonuclease Z